MRLVRIIAEAVTARKALAWANRRISELLGENEDFRKVIGTQRRVMGEQTRIVQNQSMQIRRLKRQLAEAESHLYGKPISSIQEFIERAERGEL